MKPVTYGRRAAKRTRSSAVEHSNNGRQISYERPSKRAKVRADASPVSTDLDEDHPPTNRHNGAKHPSSPSTLIGMAVHAATSRDSEHEKNSTRSSTPPAHTSSSIRARSHITYLSHTPTKSQDSLDGGTPPGEGAKLSARKLVKDLSGLFEFTSASDSKPTVPSPSRNTGLAKRMLSRSRTMSSIGNSSTSSTLESIKDESTPPLDRTDTIINLIVGPSSASSFKIPSSPAKLTKSISFDDTSSLSIKAQNSTMRTYAGSSRSFLLTLPASQIAASDSQSLDSADMVLESQEDLEVHETYSDLRIRWGVDNSEDDPYPSLIDDPSPGGKRKGKSREIRPLPIPIPNGTSNDLKSITELRNKGESRRFQDEVGYLFEGLDPESNISVRRGSALEIITKFSDLGFARKAKVADFTVQAWEALREAGAGNGDKVLDSALVVFVALVTRDIRDLIDLANRTNIVAILFRMLGSLGHKNDTLGLINSGLTDAELKKAQISRREKALLASFNRLIIKKSGLLSEGILPSNRLLITTVLASLPPSFYQPEYISILLNTLLSEMSLVPPRVSGYTTGLSLLPSPSPTYHLDTPAFALIENCLRLLEAFLLGRWKIAEDDDNSPDPLDTLRDDLAKGLVASCIAADVLMHDPKSEDVSTLARKCLESALRVLINLSHNNEPWCQTLLQDEYTIPMVMRFIMATHRQRHSTSGIVKREQDTEDLSTSEERDVYAFDRLCLALGLLTNLVQVNETAKDLTRETMLDPACPNKRSCIRTCTCPQRVSALEYLVNIYLQHCKASENEIDPIIRGHISILFGLLMRENVANQRTILAVLPGSSNRTKLVPLVETAQEFVDFHGEIMTRVAGVDGIERDGEAYDHGRDDKGESIARDVVVFLGILSESPDS